MNILTEALLLFLANRLSTASSQVRFYRIARIEERPRLHSLEKGISTLVKDMKPMPAVCIIAAM
jgi:hypothetical protein